MQINLFPTPIWILDKGENYPDDVLDWAMSQVATKSVIKSNRGGFQSHDQRFVNFPYLSYLQQELKFLPSFEFGNWWVNVNRKGDYNIAHVHPGGDLSVVWYLTDSYSAPIKFDSPFQFTRGTLYNVTHTDDDYFFEGKEGDIIIFPSDLQHSVQSNPTDESRVSIAFNLRLL